jgi:hypothetical protein
LASLTPQAFNRDQASVHRAPTMEWAMGGHTKTKGALNFRIAGAGDLSAAVGFARLVSSWRAPASSRLNGGAA